MGSGETSRPVKALPRPPVRGVPSPLAPTAAKVHNISLAPNRTHTDIEFMRNVTDVGSLPSLQTGVSSQKNGDLEASSSRSRISRIQSLRSYFKTRPLFLLLLFLPIPPLLSILYLLIGYAILHESPLLILNSQQNPSIRPTFLMTTHIGAAGGAILILPLPLTVYAVYRFHLARPSSSPSNTLIDPDPMPPARVSAQPIFPGVIQVPTDTTIHPTKSNSFDIPPPVSRFSVLTTITEHKRRGRPKLRISPAQWAKQMPPLPLPLPKKQPSPRHADNHFDDDQSANNARGESNWRRSLSFSAHARGWDPKMIGVGIVCLVLVLLTGPLAGVLGVKCLQSSVMSGDSQGRTLLTTQGAAAAGIVGSIILVSVVALFSGIVVFFRWRRVSKYGRRVA